MVLLGLTVIMQPARRQLRLAVAKQRSQSELDSMFPALAVVIENSDGFEVHPDTMPTQQIKDAKPWIWRRHRTAQGLGSSVK